MIPSGYFTAYATPYATPYATGSGGLPPDPGSGFFTAYGTSYLTGYAPGASVVSPGLPADLKSAIAARWLEVPALIATKALLCRGAAQDETTPPWAVFRVATSGASLITSDSYCAETRVTFDAVAQTSEGAEAIRTAIAAVGAFAETALEFQGGKTTCWIQADQADKTPTARLKNGKRQYVASHTFQLQVMTARSIG